MGKNLYGWELTKTKAIIKPQSNMKVVNHFLTVNKKIIWLRAI